MRKIILTKNIPSISLKENGICIYHKNYKNKLPNTPNMDCIEFDYVCENFQSTDIFSGVRTIAFVGANKMFNSSSRNHPVFDILQYNLPDTQRFYSIDEAPYVGELWRLFIHWSLVRVPFGGYTYSYLLESHLSAYRDGARNDNPLSMDKIYNYARNCVEIDYEKYFSNPKIHICETPQWVKDDYQKVKQEAFETHDNINKIIKELSDFAKSVCKERKIPQEYKIFDTPDNIQIVKTDLKVDDYLVEKLVSKIQEVNNVVKVLQP